MKNDQEDSKQVFVKMVLSNWQTQNSRLSALFDKLSDAELSQETAPGRNTGVYLLGHMAAVHDAMFTILGFRDRLYPELDEVFLHNPDKSGLPKPPVGQLRDCWKQVSTALIEHINATQPDDWFKRHNSVSEEDFAKEPHRNKLNIVINRTNHLSTHLGQLTYLSK
ncbi:MAG: DinB family protein [Bacteroidetes bacterium]|nr:DinB family protein [Bacteroidota bacterium]